MFIIAYETGKVVDFVVKSKFCKACKNWDKKDKSEEYRAWQESHAFECEVNFSGSAGAMEPEGVCGDVSVVTLTRPAIHAAHLRW